MVCTRTFCKDCKTIYRGIQKVRTQCAVCESTDFKNSLSEGLKNYRKNDEMIKTMRTFEEQLKKTLDMLPNESLIILHKKVTKIRSDAYSCGCDDSPYEDYICVLHGIMELKSIVYEWPI